MRPKSEDGSQGGDSTWQGLPPGVSMTPESDLNDQTLPTPSATPTPSKIFDSEVGDSSDEDSSEDGPTGDVPEAGDDAATLKKQGAERSQEWDLLPPPRIARGQEIFGKYRLLEKLGEGGMGDVWLVDNLELGRKSALKLLKPQIAHNDKGWRRFRREARLMAKLEHPNAIVVHDFKRTQSIGYIEMEFVRGRSLDKVIDEHKERPIPLDEIASILDQLCAVLQEAHGHLDEETGKPKPIIHRDLKPSNIMVLDHKPSGQNIKVLDFGIAKMVEEESSHEATLTNVGDVLGTPAFMSPEQVRGGWGKDGSRELDRRSDLYSVGVILYQLLTGKIPFTSRDPRGLMAAHLTEKPRAMALANPQSQVPPAVERLVMQCLEKDPDRRPSSAEEIARRFRVAIGGRPAAKSWLVPAASAAALVLLGLSYAAWSSLRPSRGDGPVPKGDAPTTPKTPPPPQPPTLRMPAGYHAVDGTSPAEDSDEPLLIQNSVTGTRLAWNGPGVYLPEGFEPDSQDPQDKVGRWPRVVVHKSSKARFILISGRVYLRGDGIQKPPDRDAVGNRLKPHWVRVKSFYIQEKEVTNGELDAYAEAHPDDHEFLSKWKNFYNVSRERTKPADDAARLPAACVSYLGASRFAAAMGAALPTEAQWELAAKSGHDDFCYPWGGEQPRRPGELMKANVSNPAGAAFVGTFPKDCTLEEHVLDMAGNVRELCRDAYRPYDDLALIGNSRDNPLEEPCEPFRSEQPGTKSWAVARAGSFLSPSLNKARVYYRDRIPADDSPLDVGFRTVLECPIDAPAAD
ncbi:Serine/threonine-protein kinase PrkC [Aquisphaera giovannonii]|uniref:Serine/threonine-protein kinase PrkC n=1 Tax=Aquisphaera giovannonii TaxID=406548 RepID=A0A5B9W0R5_9BACT|nr:bifunctional serine/threonine-protein kinase/formylglycine-generating enzyme family protein [Aquisphaera giovannonii]QEH33814.1 Serine/threonine-protein kinase PrkC [Aquisphaera giovannonii]